MQLPSQSKKDSFFTFCIRHTDLWLSLQKIATVYSLQPHIPYFPNAGMSIGTEWVTGVLFNTTIPKSRWGEGRGKARDSMTIT